MKNTHVGRPIEYKPALIFPKISKLLTPKQKRFIDNYLISLNATDAAIKAGYKEKTARSIGCQLLTKLNIRETLDERIKSIEDKTEITVEYVLKGINDLAKNAKSEGARVKAFELLGKHLAMFTDKVNSTMNVKELTDAELEAMIYEFIEEKHGTEAIEILKSRCKE